jgi:hypothetical protein
MYVGRQIRKYDVDTCLDYQKDFNATLVVKNINDIFDWRMVD